MMTTQDYACFKDDRPGNVCLQHRSVHTVHTVHTCIMHTVHIQMTKYTISNTVHIQQEEWEDWQVQSISTHSTACTVNNDQNCVLSKWVHTGLKHRYSYNLVWQRCAAPRSFMSRVSMAATSKIHKSLPLAKRVEIITAVEEKEKSKRAMYMT